jgi:hypothetical protein
MQPWWFCPPSDVQGCVFLGAGFLPFQRHLNLPQVELITAQFHELEPASTVIFLSPEFSSPC